MKIFIMILCTASLMFGYSLNRFYEDYKNENHLRACKQGVSIFAQHKKDEDFLTVYSFACLKSDMIDRLAVPITGMRNSKEARSNASYFTSILLQKKLLYNAVIDDVDISGLNLPTSDYILSRVFHLYANEDYTKEGSRYVMVQEDFKYEMYIDDTGRYKKLVIEKYKDDELIDTHKYF
ncbi:MAG: hypothetical protein ACQERK_01345 [Campylobacterota bacterium]